MKIQKKNHKRNSCNEEEKNKKKEKEEKDKEEKPFNTPHIVMTDS